MVAQDQLVGRSLGEFVLRERIGEGGFGAVYRAIQPALEREAVIKVLHARLNASKAAAERFLRESRLASKLDHPYAAHIYAFGAEPDGQLWIAMELVRGTPLDQILGLQGTLPLERFVPLLDRICEVVHTAHEQGIVHRDIKPANVMVLSRAGRLLPKLLDFGIAKALVGPGDSGRQQAAPPTDELATASTVDQSLDTPEHLGLTQRGAVMGSPLYMAPEQWVDAGDVDARTDLYALGILAYECLTGGPPFKGTTVTAIAFAHAEEAPPPVGPRLPAALDKVFAKVLAKEAKDRYATALELASAFRQASGIGADPVALPALAEQRRDALVNLAPQPIAEAAVALEAARNAHHAIGAIVQLARTTIRYLGLLALASRSRVQRGDDAAAVVDMLRELRRRALTDTEWIALGRALTDVWRDRRDAHPVPELVDAYHDASDDLLALAELRGREMRDDDAAREVLEDAVARLDRLVDTLAFVRDYPLVVSAGPDFAERWMGTRRGERATVMMRGKEQPTDVPLLLDADGVPVLSLAPLLQVAAPTPGAPPEMFLFEGRDARGARFVALPAGFEHHDDSIWTWFREQLASAAGDDEAATVESKPPYRGLSAFSADDASQFFGREKLVDAFSNRLKLQPLLAVVGRSGAGKSSFVQAGVIPALPKEWRAITMRPGPSPLAALAARLEHAAVGMKRESRRAETMSDLREVLADDRSELGRLLRADATAHGPILLVVDQLEELFTLCHDADERRVFAEAVAAAAREAADPVRVIFTLRDDFLVRTEQVPALRNRIGQGLQLLTVPGAEDLVRVLVEPAKRAGYEFDDPKLPAEMVREVADQPGALALISFTASKLWELRDRHFKQLTRAAYTTLGGVGGALARHADITLDDMPPDQRSLAREAFRHLVTSQNTRAVLARTELRQLLGSAHADRVIEQLVAARLLVASEDETGAETIEIIHEALLVNWPRLVEWRREDAEGARFREQLRAAAKQWDDRARADGLLWRGDALADFTRWRARHPGPLTDVEAAFTGASLAEAARGRRNRRALIASAFGTLIAVLIGLGVFNTRIANQKRDLAADLTQRDEDQGRRLLLAGDPLQALAHLDEAGKRGASGIAHDFLVAEAVRDTDGEVFEVRPGGRIRQVAYDHAARRFVTVHEARMEVWDATNGAAITTFKHDGLISVVAFAPGDREVMSSAANGDVALWNAGTGAVVARAKLGHPIACGGYAPDGHTAVFGGGDVVEIVAMPQLTSARSFAATAVFSCAFSPDGKKVAAGGEDGRVWIIDLASGHANELIGHDRRVYAVAFSPASDRLVTASYDATAIEWDVAAGEMLHKLPHDDLVNSAEFSPDGRSIVTASNDHTAIIWDAATGRPVRKLTEHTATVITARYSPDGRYIATGSGDASTRLWLVTTGDAVARWHTHENSVYAINFDPSGTRVLTGGDDGTAIVFDTRAQERVIALATIPEGVWSFDFSTDKQRVLTAGRDGAARIADVRTGHDLTVLRGHTSGLSGAAFSPRGGWIATAGDDGTVRLWADGTTRPETLVTEAGPLVHLAWSSDGSALAATGTDRSLRVWDFPSRRLVFERRLEHNLFYWVSFSPDGSRLLTVANDHHVRIWDRAGNIVDELEDPDGPQSAAYDPTGKRVASVVASRSVKIWNVTTHATIAELVGHVGEVVAASWNHQGTMVATASEDGSTRVWDAASGDELENIPHNTTVTAVAFTPDDDQLAISYFDGTTVLVELPTSRPANLDEIVRCRVPYRPADERLQHVTRPACSRY